MTPPTVREWRDDDCWLPRACGNAFVRSGSGHGPAVLLLHGFRSSSYDFRSIIDRLGQRSSLTLDFLGFGLPDKPARHTYSLMEQADIAQQVVADAVLRLLTE
ncbi:MAG TPA: alpha/beta fold hydrolase [Mycobacterium sp.]|nr:alpha/beta fold hydrolase [Mycobacterium sp.]